MKDLREGGSKGERGREERVDPCGEDSCRLARSKYSYRVKQKTKTRAKHSAGPIFNTRTSRKNVVSLKYNTTTVLIRRTWYCCASSLRYICFYVEEKVHRFCSFVPISREIMQECLSSAVKCGPLTSYVRTAATRARTCKMCHYSYVYPQRGSTATNSSTYS